MHVTPHGVAARAALALLILINTPRSAVADETSVISLTEAVTKTLAGNPGLKAFGQQIRAQEARVVQSGLGPNPELGLMVENALGSGTHSSIRSAETTLSVAWILEHQKRQRRVDASLAGVSLYGADAEIRRLDAAAETARLFLDCLALQERLVLSDYAVSLAEQTAATIRQRVVAGRTLEADLAQAQVQLSRARLGREDIEHSIRVAFRRLAAQWGETEPPFERVIGDIHDLSPLESFSALLARVDHTPNITRYLSEKRLREAQLRLAQAEAKPDWRISAGLRRFERSDDFALVGEMTIPLTLGNRNQGNIAEARARLDLADADQAVTRVRIETQLFALHQEVEHSIHRLTTLRDEILPQLEHAVAETQRAYDAGRYAYSELQIVQTGLLDVRADIVEATIDANRQIIEIERLTGITVIPAPTLP